ncbi:MAG: phosphate ABC transporter permease subunit PstC, partial [Pseudomonadota bacterium]
MLDWLTLAAVLALTVLGFTLGKTRANAAAGAGARLHSLPNAYGYFVALATLLPAIALFLLWRVAEPMVLEALIRREAAASLDALSPEAVELFIRDVRAVAAGRIPSQDSAVVARVAEAYAGLKSYGGVLAIAATLGIATAGLAWARRRVSPEFRARNAVERVLQIALLACSTIAVLTTLGIVLSLFFEAIRFFSLVPIGDFLFGVNWSPQTALRADQVGQSGSFGAVPLFAGTLMITAIALLVAGPVGLFSAIYLSEYASPPVRRAAKPFVEILAGIPTVVYGFFALLTVGPFIRDAAGAIGLDVATQSALAAGLVMGVMIVPFVSSLADDVINAVPQALRDGSYAMGATKSETIRQVIVPAALPGIVGAILLAASRAIGVTMIVVLGAGAAARLSLNPFEA